MYYCVRRGKKKKKTRLNKKENKKSVCSTIKFNVNYYAQRLLRELIQYLRVNFFFFFFIEDDSTDLLLIPSFPSRITIFARLKTSKPIFLLLRLAIKRDENETFGIIIEWMDTILTVTKLYRRFWLNVCNL